MTTSALIAPVVGAGRRPALLVIAFACAGLIVLLLVAPLVISDFDPTHQSLLEARQSPSIQHWFGTDSLGRDVLTRVIAGTSLTVIGPVLVALIASSVAIPLALLSASRGGILASAIVRVSDAIMAVPALLFIVVVVGLLGGGYWLAVGVLAFLTAPATFRVLRASAIGQQSLPYIEVARVMGAGRARVMFVHVLPNMLPTIVTTFLLDLVGGLVSLSSLSFLGLGSDPGSPEWGTMLAENLSLMRTNPAAAVVPAFLLILTAFSVTAIGDWLHARLERGSRD